MKKLILIIIPLVFFAAKATAFEYLYPSGDQISPDTYGPETPSTYSHRVYDGVCNVYSYDAREDPAAKYRDFHCFTAHYAGGQTVTIRVNLEFGDAEAAGNTVDEYGGMLGRLSVLYLSVADMDRVSLTVHMGDKRWATVAYAVYIFTEWSSRQSYVDPIDGKEKSYMEEVLAHEFGHVFDNSKDANFSSLGDSFFRSDAWQAAVLADPGCISWYACNSIEEGYGVEDVPETLQAFAAILSGHLSPEQEAEIEEMIPNRLKVLREYNPNMWPLQFWINAAIIPSHYNQATSGQGFVFEVLDNFLAAYWFTYNIGGGKTWRIANGPISGDTAYLNLYDVTGGEFNAPTPVDAAVEGELTIVFESCQKATVHFRSDTLGEGTIPMEIVSNDMLSRCEKELITSSN